MEYTELYADKIDKAFEIGSKSQPFVNQDYSFIGAKTVKVTSFGTVAMNDYNRKGAVGSAYGTAEQVENKIQEMTMTKDRSFTFKTDAMDEEETKVKGSDILQQQLAQVVMPEIDTYRFGVMSKGADEGNIITTKSESIYNVITDLTEKLDEAGVPEGGRLIAITPQAFKYLKQDDNFNKPTEWTQQNVKVKGLIGEVDGTPVIKVPANRLETGVEVMMAHPSATVAPVKLSYYGSHTNPTGWNGTVYEGRFYYDAFVLDNKKKGIAVYKPTGGLEKAIKSK